MFKGAQIKLIFRGQRATEHVSLGHSGKGTLEAPLRADTWHDSVVLGTTLEQPVSAKKNAHLALSAKHTSSHRTPKFNVDA